MAPIDKLSVVITILLAFIFLHEQPSFKVIVGALLVASGSILMILDQEDTPYFYGSDN